MKRTFWGSVTAATTLTLAFCGCNTILDNQPGTLASLEEAGALPDPGPTTPPTGEPPVTGQDSGTTTPVDAGNEKPSADCETGKRMCFGACVSMVDPSYGCGDPSCAPCASTHSTMGCQGRTCVVAACDPGFADCNKDPNDGCEVDLSKNATCGTCNSVCGAATPLCAPAGGSFQCTNGCTPAAPTNCGNDCVDTMTSVSHCGACNMKCPVVANGTTTCGAGACAFTCKADFHKCGNKCPAKTDPASCGPDCIACPVPPGGAATCVNDACGIKCTAPNKACRGACTAPTDPTACGAACTICPVPANGTATCAADTCGIQCNAGFGNCDANTANGCETTFASDPLHCGQCNKPCAAGQVCNAGVCAAAPPPP